MKYHMGPQGSEACPKLREVNDIPGETGDREHR
jgi:hypothetical protein